MSLIDEALKRARMEAAQRAAESEGLPYPAIPRHMAPRRRRGWLAAAAVALAVLAGLLLGWLAASRRPESGTVAELRGSEAGSATPAPAVPVPGEPPPAAPTAAEPRSPAASAPAASAATAAPRPTPEPPPLRMATPETATPETATPETATPETATPETATPETATPETAVRRPAVPEPAAPPTAVRGPAGDLRPDRPAAAPTPDDPPSAAAEPIASATEPVAKPPADTPPAEPTASPPAEPTAAATAPARSTSAATPVVEPESGVLLLLPDGPGESPDEPAGEPSTAGPAESYAQRMPLPGGGAIELGGIAWSETGPFALINGRVVGPGSTIEGYTLERIGPGHVVLTGAGRRIHLSLQ